MVAKDKLYQIRSLVLLFRGHSSVCLSVRWSQVDLAACSEDARSETFKVWEEVQNRRVDAVNLL